MKWCRLEYHYGPGHQAIEIKYVSVCDGCDKDNERKLMYEKADDWMEQWACRTEILDKLPIAVWNEKYAEYQATITFHEHLIRTMRQQGHSSIDPEEETKLVLPEK